MTSKTYTYLLLVIQNPNKGLVYINKVAPSINYITYYRSTNNLLVTSKNEFSNSPIHEFKVLQNVLKNKKQDLIFLLK